MTATPRKRGRPPGSTDLGARRKRIEIRVSEEEERRISDQASRSNCTVSKYIRGRALAKPTK